MSQCRACPLAVAYEQPNVTGKYHSRQSLLAASPLAHRAPSCLYAGGIINIDQEEKQNRF